MKPVTIAPRAMLDKKPPHGQPCTRCGLCCHAVLCKIGIQLFRREVGPCPALRWDANGSRCGIVDDCQEEYREAAKFIIGSGTGCDARFNGEPADQKFYRKMEQWDRDNRLAVEQARKLWAMEPMEKINAEVEND